MLIIVNTSTIFFFINSFSLSDDWKANLRSICFSTTSVLLTIHLTALFLQIPDMTGKIFDELLGLPWYLYNRKNCTTLLILLENSVNPIYINLLGTGRLDAASVGKYIKMIYSTTTVLHSLKE
ncbi:uncharacterized protein LOC123015640 [Tribolium madens]|uniref:uncharacterized protein LOC123015640 n=1 Tax=Tribolium madens TaxID=41895 RepID=UPI001CF731B2|nr:uncharacterized protein LOC123015640 [Tribolium madens]